jgi:eukaryotic-like serine/threonine-protein kinase
VGGAPEIAPGSLIAERYRIETPLSVRPRDGRIGELWRAHDEVLARPVAILLVPDDNPGVPEVLAGARAAARLTHAAVVRVYDAGETPGLAYVVTEFLAGGSLEAQLLVGPLEPIAAVDLVSDLAVGVAAAHDVGLHGLLLTPRSVLFTATGAPRLAGIGLAGHTVPGHGLLDADGHSLGPDAGELERARFDAVGLARLLYAALTARWPGPAPDSALPSAPYAEGHLRTPRQVRGGVPREVDAVVTQALGDDLLLRGLPAIASPADFVTALAPLRTADDHGHPYGADTQPIAELDARQGQRGRPGKFRGQRRSTAGRWRRWAIVIGLLILAVAGGSLAFTGSPSYLRFVGGAPAPTAASSHPSSSASTTAPATGAITPTAVTEFDPYGDHTDPHVTEAPRAVDGNPSTAWRTQIYRTADLGKLKPGVGLLIDLGSARKVSAVHVLLVGAGTSVELFDSNSDAPPANEKVMSAAASQADAPSDVTLRPAPGTTARYWVLWLTTLPPTGTSFQGGVAEISFLP